MVIAEPTGLFVIPFFITIGNNIIDILNETGTIFVPFAILMCVAWGKARAMGDDEGSPSIMAFKIVETQFYVMFVILIWGVLPGAPSTSNDNIYKYRQYACSNVPSIIQGANTIDDLKPTSSFGSQYGNDSTNLFFGLTHELSTAFSQTAIGTLNCKQGQNRAELISEFANLETKPKTQEAIKLFHKSCLAKATQRIDELIASNTKMTIDFSKEPYNTPDAFAFNSQPMKRAYDGSISGEGRLYPLTVYTTDSWVKESNANTSLDCTQAMKDIQSAIRSDLNDISFYDVFSKNFDEYTEDMLEFLNQNPSDVVTKSNAETELFIRAYNNSAAGWFNPFVIGHKTALQDPNDRQLLSDIARTTSKMTYVTTTGFMTANGGVMGPGGEFTNSFGQKEQLNGNTEHLMNTFSYFGTVWADIAKNIETRTYVRTAPVAATLAQGCILGFGGLILVLSGYSSKILLHLILFYISAATAPLLINLGVIFDSYLTYVMQWYDAHVQFKNEGAAKAVNFVGTTVIIGLPLGWMALFQLLGVHVSSQMDAASSSSSGAAQDMGRAMGKVVQGFTRLAHKLSKLPARAEKARQQNEQLQKDLKVAVNKSLAEEMKRLRTGKW